MSVFIHNIGIPKTGYVDVRIFSDGRATTQTGDRPFYREMKIEEVPEKHGRLIDADALIETMFDNLVAKTMMFGGQYVYTKAEIDNAPTIIPAEEGE